MTPPPRRALVVFARVPVLGEVKTRLAASIGAPAALAAYRELVEHTLATTAALPDCTRVVTFTPADGEGAMRECFGEGVRYEAQVGPDLGARLHAAVRRRLADGADRVVVIGTDCPTIAAADIERGWAALERADLVLGPSEDGGYWLIGLKADHAEPFRDIPWSTPETLGVTLERARDAGLKVALLDRKVDVDTVVEWRAWKAAAE
jgi:rSAM/selenodomain-associated transferase 1